MHTNTAIRTFFGSRLAAHCTRLIFLAAISLPAAARAGELRGVLSDAEGTPIANRLIHLYAASGNRLVSVRTDANGSYSTGKRLSGDCTLVLAEAAGGGPLSRVVYLAGQVTVNAAGVTVRNFTLVPATATRDGFEALRLLGGNWPVQMVYRNYAIDPNQPVRPVAELFGQPAQIADMRKDYDHDQGSYRAYCRVGLRVTDGRLTWIGEENKNALYSRRTDRGLEIGNGSIALILPSGETPTAAPIGALRGPDGVWFGHGAWKGVTWTSCKVHQDAIGPVFSRHIIVYRNANDDWATVTVTLSVNDDFFVIREETSAALPGRWVLDLNAGYAPDRVRQYRYYQAFPPAPITPEPHVIASIQPWTFCGIMDYRETVSVFRGEGRRDALALFSVNGSEWTLGDGRHFFDVADFSSRNGWRMAGDRTAITLRRDDQGRIVAEWPLQAGMRTSGLALYDTAADQTRHRAVDVRFIASDTPLSDVLAMSLAWAAPTSAPLLHGGIGRWREVAKRAEPNDTFAYGYVSGRRDLIPALRKQLFDLIARVTAYFLYPAPFPVDKPERRLPGYVGYGQRLIEVGPLARQLAETADWAIAMGVLSAEELGRTRAAMAFTAYKLSDPDLYAGLNALGNFKVDGYYGLMLLTIMLRGHPDQERFWRHYERQLMQDVRDGIYLYDDGGGNECPIYRAMSLNFLMRQAWYQQVHGIGDLLDRPRFKAALEWLAESTTPPIPGQHDATPRVLPLIGDTTTMGAAQFGLFGLAAVVYRERDPAFAERMLWHWNLMGRPLFFGHGLDDTTTLNRMAFGMVSRRGTQVTHEFGTGTPPSPYGSRTIDGVGCVLRKDWGTPDEFMFLMKAGRASGHYHPEDGTFLLFAWGVPLSSGYGKYPYMTDAWRYNLVRFNGRSNWSRGKVTGFLTANLSDAVVARIPVRNMSINPELNLKEQLAAKGRLEDSTWEFVQDVPASWWERSVIYNRADAYFVIYDQTGPSYATDWFAQVMSDDVSWAEGRLNCKGRAGVNLDLHVLKPTDATPEITPPVKILFAQEIAAQQLQVSPRWIEQSSIRIHQPAESDILTIWHPRKIEVTPALDIVRTGTLVKVTTPSGTSLFICERESGDFRAPRFHLKGSRGYLIAADDDYSAGLLAGTVLAFSGTAFTVTGDTKLQAQFKGETLQRLEVYATAAATVTVTSPNTLRLKPEARGKTLVGTSFEVPVQPGRSVFRAKARQ